MKNILTNKIKFVLIIFLCPFFLFVQGQKKVAGAVVSETGALLENVSISLANNPTGIIYTDANGAFEIEAADDQYCIIEYKNTYRKTMKVSDIRQNKNIVLDTDSKLVQVGFGQELRKKELASSVGYADRKKLERVTSLDVGSTLFGQIQGLCVFQNAGYFADDRSPGLNIRGQATTRDNSILILIDGVERPLNTILPEEIESVTVLRDAAAKARYGMRGANGVLLLTTRRGSKGAIRFMASVEQGFTQPTRLPTFLDAASYAKAENEARTNEGLTPRYTDAEIGYFQSGQYPYLYPNVDWLDEVLKNSAYFSRYNFSFSGGSDITHYFVSLNYQNENGLYRHTDRNDDFSTQLRNDKVNMRTNIDVKLTPTTLVKINLGGFVSMNRQPATPGAGQSNAEIVMFNEQQYSMTRLASHNIVGNAFAIPSALFPVKNEDGTWGGTNQFDNNPVAQISDVGFDKNHIRSFFNEISIKQDLNFLINGLSAEVFGAYYNQADYWENKIKTFEYKEVTPKLDASGNVTGSDSRMLGQNTDLTATRYSGNQQRTSYDFRTELSYNKVFGVHAFNSWLLYQMNQYDMHVTNQVYRYRNFAGNIHYGYAGKYFLDGTLAYSGSNRIQKKGDRFEIYPSIAAAWMLSNEPFMESVSFLDMLKIRASYGKTGNGLIEMRDLTSDKYGGGYSYNFGATHDGAGGTRETELGISHKKYETSLESNIGLDVKLFNKLDLTGELFFVKRKNIFVDASGQYSTVLGLLPLMVPEGEVENKGYELEATWSDRVGDVSYFVSGMFSQYKNKIINMNEEYRPYDYMKRTGKSIGQYYGWQSAGFFRDEADIAARPTQLFGKVRPGDVIYRDLNGDNYVDEYDQTAIGYSGFPEIYYSFSAGFGWKGVELSALFQGTGNASAYLSQSHVFWPLRGDDNISTWYKDYWTPSNPDGAKLPRLAKQSDNNYRTNDIWVRNKSFLKLRYVELAYSFPKNMISSLKLEKLRIYLRGRDLFSIDDIDYVDPEGVGNTYPSLKSYNIGVSVNF